MGAEKMTTPWQHTEKRSYKNKGVAQMKKIGMACGFFLLSTSVVFAGSQIKGASINTNNSKNAVNVGIGKESEANLNSTKMEGSKATGILYNENKGKTTINVGIGENVEANQGSIRMENSQATGAVLNTPERQKHDQCRNRERKRSQSWHRGP